MSVRPITDTLRSIQRGAVLDDASEKLADLVKAVDAAGKPGKLVIEITVKKASRGGAMHITAKTTAKKPGGEDTFEALMFATPEGNLQGDNPAQEKLDLRTVDTSTGEIRTVKETA